MVLHYTAMASADAALTRLCAPEAQVSAHYLISETGGVVRLVEEAARAWHAGAGAWGQVRDVNSRSIGIELANDAASPFPAPQMDALEVLLGGIVRRWSIHPARVIGHSDCAPGRKIDPGPRFDWARLARRGLAVRAEDHDGGPGGDADFVAAMARAGYTGSTDPAALLAALRLRHRQGRSGGPRDGRDMGLARDLARRFPVDRTAATA